MQFMLVFTWTRQRVEPFALTVRYDVLPANKRRKSTQIAILHDNIL